MRGSHGPRARHPGRVVRARSHDRRALHEVRLLPRRSARSGSGSGIATSRKTRLSPRRWPASAARPASRSARRSAGGSCNERSTRISANRARRSRIGSSGGGTSRAVSSTGIHRSWHTHRSSSTPFSNTSIMATPSPPTAVDAERMPEVDLHRLVTKGFADRPLQELKLGCRKCRTRSELTVRPPRKSSYWGLAGCGNDCHRHISRRMCTCSSLRL